MLNEKFKLKFFDKKENEDLRDYFMPVVREYMFWTFSLTNEQKKEIKDMPNDMQALALGKYECNIFEKGDSEVICFKNGVCFVITSDKKLVSKLVQFKEQKEMQKINLREDIAYNLPQGKKNANAHVYAYVLQLYKMITLNKVEKAMKEQFTFDKARIDYVNLMKNIYSIEITDKDDFAEKLKEELKLEDKVIDIDNEFDLLYKNYKLNDNASVQRLCIGLFVVLIIIGMIILGNRLL